MTSLRDLYSVAVLPRIPDLRLHERVSVPSAIDANSNYIDVGISRSVIATYVLRPTPRLIWSYPLSPLTVVECLEVEEKSEDEKLYVAGVSELKRFKLILIHRDNENVKTSEVTLKKKAKDILIRGSLVYIVLEDGSLELYRRLDSSLEKVPVQLPATPSGKLEFATFITEHDFGSDNIFSLCVVSSKASVTVLLRSIDNEQVYEVKRANISGAKTAKYTYLAGMLYQLNLDKKSKETISSYSILNFNMKGSIDVSSIISKDKTSDNIELLSPAPERLLLSTSTLINLINYKFESCLYSFDYDHQVSLLHVAPVKGNSLKHSKTRALYLEVDQKQNNTKLSIVSIDVGMNNLRECLGKSLLSKKQDHFEGLPNLIEDNLAERAKSLSKELDEVYEFLSSCRKKNDLAKWEKVLVPFLKNKPWLDIQNNINDKSKFNEFLVFDVEKDRTVESSFIHKVSDLILDDEKTFIPEFSLTYLLTHPLFPYEHASSILSVLQGLEKPRLLRQAVITCPGIPIKELALQLTNESQEIFNDIVYRLVNEFTVSQITHALRQILLSTDNEFNLDLILTNLVNSDTVNCWYLVHSIIDVGGLFNWPDDTIKSLITIIDNKMDVITQNNYNLTLVNQALLINEPLKKLNKKKSVAKKSTEGDILDYNNEQLNQLNAMLSINDTSSKKLKDESIEITKKVASYSIDKLVI